MDIANLSISLGLDGAQKAIDELKKVGDVLKQVASGENKLSFDTKGLEKVQTDISSIMGTFLKMGEVILGSKENLAEFQKLASKPITPVVAPVMPAPDNAEEKKSPRKRNYTALYSAIDSWNDRPDTIPVPEKGKENKRPGILSKAVDSSGSALSKFITPFFDGSRENPVSDSKKDPAAKYGDEEKAKRTKQAVEEDKQLRQTMGARPPDTMDKGVKNFTTGLKDMASASFAAKAALVGLLYAAQQKMASAGENAVGLKNVGALTGVATKTLQQYQYAGRQVGLTNEEVLGSFEQLQTEMANIKWGKGMPEGWANFAAKMNMGSHIDVDKFMKEPDLLIQKLQEYAKKEKDIGLRNMTLTGIVGKNMASGIVQNAFAPEKMAHAPIMGDKEIKGAAAANSMWKEFSNSMDRVFAGFSGSHGGQVIKALEAITIAGLKVTGMLLDIAEHYHIFDMLSSAADKLGPILKFVASNLEAVIDLVKGLNDLLMQAAIDLWNGKSVNWSKMLQIIVGLFEKVYVSAQKVWEKISEATGLVNPFMVIDSAVKKIIETFKSLYDWLSKVITKGDVFRSIADAISTAFGGTVSSIKDTIGTLGSLIKSGVSAAADFISGNAAYKPDEGKEWHASVGAGGGDKPKSVMGPNPEKPKPSEVMQSLDWKAVLGLDAKALEKIGIMNIMGNVIAPNMKIYAATSDILQGILPSNFKPSFAGQTNTTNNYSMDQDIHINHQGNDPSQTAGVIQNHIDGAFQQLNSTTTNG